MSSHRTDWFYAARWGVATHYLGTPEQSAESWQAQVDAFDVVGLATQVASMGAGYLLFTLGQNSGHYCSPNAKYDEFTGIAPSKLSRRDLLLELADALALHGVALMAYLPSGGPAYDHLACERLGWEWGYEGGWPNGYQVLTHKRLVHFQHKWEAVIREWSERWGSKVRGWWFDGCYFPDDMYQFKEEPNFASFAAAARSGNPDAIVAFNPGIEVTAFTPEEDYTAGETADPGLIQPAGRFLEGEQLQVWSYLGQSWCQPPLRFSDEEAIAHTRRLLAGGAVVTWDVPIKPSGLLDEAALAQLQALGKALGPGPRD